MSANGNTPEDKRLTLKKIEVPQFQPHIKEADLPDFTKRDQKLLLASSVMEQKIDFLIAQAVEHNTHARRMEAELLSARREQREINWFHSGVRWTVVIIASSILAAVINGIFAKL